MIFDSNGLPASTGIKVMEEWKPWYMTGVDWENIGPFKGFSTENVYQAAELKKELDNWAAELVGGEEDHIEKVTLYNENAKYAVISMLQKSVRRGKPAWAKTAISALVNAGLASTVWRRLGVIALEDMGMCGLPYLSLITWVLEDKSWINHELRFELAWAVARRMCEGNNDRSACDIGSIMGMNGHKLEFIREDMPYSPESIAEILCDSGQSVMRRVVAHKWLAKKPKLAELKWEVYRKMKLPSFLLAGIVGYPRQYKDDMWTALPVLWDMIARSEDLTIDDSAFPKDEQFVGGAPACALDMFTWTGKRAMTYFKKSCAEVDAFYKARPSIVDHGDSLGYAVFAVEGGLLKSSLCYSGREELAVKTLEEEFESVGLTMDDAAELCGYVDDNMHLLMAARKKIGGTESLIYG